MPIIAGEFRYALRILSRRRLLVAVAVATLGLGIGLTTTMFSIVDGVMLRGLPVERSKELRYVERTFEDDQRGDPAVPMTDFLAWRSEARAFSALAAFEVTTVNVSGTEARPSRYSAARVTANLFEELGVQPIVGRRFLPGEDRPGAAPVVLISDTVWRDHFDRAARIEGLTLHVNGEVHTVVGVMPPGFRFPLGEDVWLPLVVDETRVAQNAAPTLDVVGRLAPGVTPAAAQAEMTGIAERRASASPGTRRGIGLVLKTHMSKFLGDSAMAIFYAGLLAVVGVFLIAATNVTHLLLALASLRTREVALRAALGAGRGRLLFQMMLEAFLLAVAGGALGFALARVGITSFNEAIAGTNPPFWVDIRVDVRETLFVAGLIAVVTVVAGVVPAVRASGTAAGEILCDEVRGSTGGRTGRFSRVLVMVEVALSCGLLVAASLTTRTIVAVRRTDFGFSMDDVLTGTVTLASVGYRSAERRHRFWEGLVLRLEQLPGIRSVALVSILPATGSGLGAFALDGIDYASPREYPQARVIVASPRLFETFAIGVVEGRDFTRADTTETRPVAIVNQPFVDRFFGGRSPVGRRVLVADATGELTPTAIVGVAPDMRLGGVRGLNPEAIYLPLAQQMRPTMSLAVRTYGEPLALATSVRDAVAVLDPELPIYAVRSMRDAIHLTTWFYTVFGAVFIGFGFVALVLVVVGLYGLMAFSVTRRTREIGVRMAMGAKGGDVLRMVLGQAVVQLAVGIFAGLALALYLSRLLVAFLVGVQPWDPAVFAVVVMGLFATGLLACLGPARRAMRINPMDALRHE